MTNRINENKKRLTKVILEYEDGDKEYIDGNDVKVWQDALDYAIQIEYIHSGHIQDDLKNVAWKKVNDNE